MTFEERLREILDEDALPPFDPDLEADEPELPAEREPEPEPTPPPVVTLAAMGGRGVELDEEQFRRLAATAGVAGPDLDGVEFGRVVQAAKVGHRHLLDRLLAVRSEIAPLYRIRTPAGRPWHLNTMSITKEKE